MIASRALTAARAMTARRLPTMALNARRLPAVARRAYSEGDVAKSREFGKKEKAHEDMYVHEHERQQLARLRAEIEKKQAELTDLQKKEAEIAKK